MDEVHFVPGLPGLKGSLLVICVACFDREVIGTEGCADRLLHYGRCDGPAMVHLKNNIIKLNILGFDPLMQESVYKKVFFSSPDAFVWFILEVVVQCIAKCCR